MYVLLMHGRVRPSGAICGHWGAGCTGVDMAESVDPDEVDWEGPDRVLFLDDELLPLQITLAETAVLHGCVLLALSDSDVGAGVRPVLDGLLALGEQMGAYGHG